MSGNENQGVTMEEISSPKSKPKQKHPPDRGYETSTVYIKTPPFSYVHLSLITPSPSQEANTLDEITVRSYLTSALTQFLGISGSAISVDILKVEGTDEKKVDVGGEVWVRVPREDLAPFLAAVGGWVGEGGKVGWSIKGSGNWLSSLVGNRDVARIWNE